MFKKAIDKSGEDLIKLGYDKNLSEGAKSTVTGVAGDKLVEPMPAFNKTPSEKVFSGDNGSHIVLGRDRSDNILSGYGGKGDTQAASIDLVVGRKSYMSRAVTEEGDRVWADPDFELDAARIYMSQKSDIDSYFKLPRGKYPNSVAKSAIGLKADSIRILSREAIKLVSGMDGRNSQGGASKASYGIDLIANSDDSDLQPMVKGENLVGALNTIIEHIDKLNGIVEAFMRYQMKINYAAASHTHASFGTPSPELAAITYASTFAISAKPYSSIMTHKLNSSFIKLNYLSPLGKQYINSRHNNTT